MGCAFVHICCLFLLLPRSFPFLSNGALVQFYKHKWRKGVGSTHLLSKHVWFVAMCCAGEDCELDLIDYRMFLLQSVHLLLLDTMIQPLVARVVIVCEHRAHTRHVWASRHSTHIVPGTNSNVPVHGTQNSLAGVLRQQMLLPATVIRDFAGNNVCHFHTLKKPLTELTGTLLKGVLAIMFTNFKRACFFLSYSGLVQSGCFWVLASWRCFPAEIRNMKAHFRGKHVTEEKMGQISLANASLS